MAEVTGLRHNALPYPIYGAPFGVTFPILDADGDLVTGATGLDSERSLNGDTFADCTNEATEIATSSGIYYLLLTAAEMTADVVSVIVKTSSSGAKTTVLTLYPRKLPSVRSGTSQSGSSSTITLDSGASAVDDYYNGMVCVATLDSVVEVRVIGDYVGSTKVATIEGPNWNNAAPDSDDTFVIRLPEGARISGADALAWLGTTIAAADTAGYPKVTIKDGTGTGEIDTTSGGVLVAAIAANAITATAINADAITAAKIADGAIDAATFASGAINAAAIASDAITAAKIADGAIDAATFAANAITATAIASDAITAAKIADGAIDAATFATGAITADAIAADAIGASELAADAVTEIQSGLATASALATVAGYIDTEIADIQSRLPAALTGDGNMKADALRISGSATAADNLEGGALGLVLSSCAADSTTTAIETNLTEATNDHYNGRVITFTSGALLGQSTDITDYDGGTKTLTVTALTEAPAENDTFVIS